jgi:septal ring factor EnvC (AmiA/AmiB activator)
MEMFLDRKPFLYLWRPVYRVIFGGIVRPWLGRMKEFFTAESSADLAEISAKIRVVQTAQQRFERDLELMAHRLGRLEGQSQNAAGSLSAIRADLEDQSQRMVGILTARETEERNQWRATESLLLSLFSNSAGNSNRLANGGADETSQGAVGAKTTLS